MDRPVDGSRAHSTLRARPRPARAVREEGRPTLRRVLRGGNAGLMAIIGIAETGAFARSSIAYGSAKVEAVLTEARAKRELGELISFSILVL